MNLLEKYAAENRLIAFIYDFSMRTKKLNLNSYSSSIAFFLFLSFAPMVVLICSIIPYTPITEEDLLVLVKQLIPEMFNKTVTNAITRIYDKSAGVLTVSALATVWSAGKGIMAMMVGLNVVNDVEEKRNYVVIRLVASFYMLIMVAAIFVSLVLMVFGNFIFNNFLIKLPNIEIIHDLLLKPRYLYLFLFLTLIFTIFYTFMPNKKLKIREQIPGAVLASLGWLIFSFFFSIYINMSTSFTMYGSLALVVIGMLWIYFCMNIFLIGAYLNHVFKPLLKVLVYPRSVRNNSDR